MTPSKVAAHQRSLRGARHNLLSLAADLDGFSTRTRSGAKKKGA